MSILRSGAREASRRAILAGAILFSVLAADFVFMSGFSLGFTITVCASQLGVFLLFPRPASGKTLAYCVFLAACILALGSAYSIYSDAVLLVLDFPVLCLLLLIQLLLYSGSVPDDSDGMAFIKEVLVSPFMRPLKFIGKIPAAAKDAPPEPAEGQAAGAVSHRSMKAVGKALLGIAAALPVLLLVTWLLSSADLIFRQYTAKIFDILLNVKIREYLFALIWGAVIFPFVFSFLYSFAERWRDGQTPSAGFPAVIDPVAAAAAVCSLNIVYALFTAVQFGALAGAFTQSLPEGVTYAEYARQGFFQLCAVSVINIAVVVAGGLFVRRSGRAGKIMKAMSVLLIVFTFFLLVSAGYRMKMYIDAYALSQLRLLVSLFMGLIALMLVYALIREFLPTFRFFRTAFVTAVLVLILTNYLNTDRVVARYNLARYEADPRLDAEYLAAGLSYDAVPDLANFVKKYHNEVSDGIAASLQDLYDGELRDYREGNWKRFNLSRERAEKAIRELAGEN